MRTLPTVVALALVVSCSGMASALDAPQGDDTGIRQAATSGESAPKPLAPQPAAAAGGQAAAGSGADARDSACLSLPAVVYANNYVKTTSWTQLNGYVSVAMNGLRAWAACGNDPNDLRLYLAGRKLPASQPALTNAPQEYVNFPVKLVGADRELWLAILSEARRARDNAIRLSVGRKGDTQPFESKVYLVFNVYPGYTWAVILGILALLLALVILGQRSELLRAPGPTRTGARAPYSLARVQMAWWFCLVMAAYLYIWLVTGDYNTLTTSVLALIGISAATGLAAVVVDNEKADDTTTKRRDMETTVTALEARLCEIGAQPADGTQLFTEWQEKSSEQARVKASLGRLPPPSAPPTSKGLVRDLLSDATGVSLHRFQMVVWTIVLAVVFVRQVDAQLAMPDFDAGLLGLMGISSGTYVGFKFPEKPK